ncbi:MAG: hypothetical protein WB610_15520 [Rhodomicrobium sp.]
MPFLDLGQALHPSQPNYREEATYLPLLLAGIVLGASFLFGDGIISPTIRRSRPSAHRMDKLKVVWRYPQIYRPSRLLNCSAWAGIGKPPQGKDCVGVFEEDRIRISKRP